MPDYLHKNKIIKLLNKIIFSDAYCLNFVPLLIKKQAKPALVTSYE